MAKIKLNTSMYSYADSGDVEIISNTVTDLSSTIDNLAERVRGFRD